MSLFDNLFQKLFGIRSNHEPYNNQGYDDHRQSGNGFRNPIWQPDDDDEDDAAEFSRQNRSGMHFNVFSDPFEMTRYFESQIDDIMKNFFGGFGQGFGSAIESFEHGSIPALPPANPGNLRDEVLKPGYEYPSPNNSAVPKLDGDLDGKITASDIPTKWRESDALVPVQPVQPTPHRFNFKSFGKSVSSQVIRRPDGTMEQRQTITDSEGNTETTITRQLGDKQHTVKTMRDKNGVESKTEEFINIDQSQLQEFDKKWQPLDQSPVPFGNLNPFSWHKFFNHDPRL